MDKQKKIEINNCLIGIKNRDASALNRLYELVAHSIRYITLKYMRNEDDARDLEQDFWADIYNMADQFSYMKNGFSYLGTIATRMAINRYKKLKGEKAHSVGEVDFKLLRDFECGDAFDSLEDRLCVQKAIDRLTPVERLIIQLSVFEHKTIIQIAKEIGISKSEVGRLKLAAEQSLKNDLTGHRSGNDRKTYCL